MYILYPKQATHVGLKTFKNFPEPLKDRKGDVSSLSLNMGSRKPLYVAMLSVCEAPPQVPSLKAPHWALGY